MKTPDWNDLKLGTVVVLESLYKPVEFGFKRLRVKGTGSLFQTPFIAVEWMQLHSLHFVRKCTKDDYCLWIKNYARMCRVSQNIIPCEKFIRHLHYVGAYLHLHRVHIIVLFECVCLSLQCFDTAGWATEIQPVKS